MTHKNTVLRKLVNLNLNSLIHLQYFTAFNVVFSCYFIMYFELNKTFDDISSKITEVFFSCKGMVKLIFFRLQLVVETYGHLI